MGIFGSIMDKLFHHSTAQTATPSQTASQPTSGTAGAGQQAQAGTAAQQPQTGSSAMGTAMSPGQPRLQNVDVEAVLIQLARTKGGGGNWRTSVVDLLKLLDLDSVPRPAKISPTSSTCMPAPTAVPNKISRFRKPSW